LQHADTMRGRLIGLVGRQGVGKSAALQAIYVHLMEKAQEDEEPKPSKRDSKDSPEVDLYKGDAAVLFKWRRDDQLFKSLIDGTHELSADFKLKYHRIVWDEVRFNEGEVGARKYKQLGRLNLNWAEASLGSSGVWELRREAWLRTLVHSKFILIDMPDYSKTDRRLLAKDLESVYWLWNMIALNNYEANVVIAIQKEMFHGHFFFDKMDRIELEPLEPQQMLEAYTKRFFGCIEPFTEDALLTLARMSRGIFRRFLRYITLTLDHSEPNAEGQIDTGLVKQAVPIARLVEDMELELSELFPKHSDLRLMAVRLIMLLEERGERKQSELAELLEVEPYMLSRLLAKLETARYVTRRREGNDKIVSVYSQQPTLTPDKHSSPVAVV
jgi:DNA-binding transcriptional ArsR family regulator